MPTQTLSAEFVNGAVCPDGRAKINYYDTAITGFILEVRATGGKTYALRYRDGHNRQCQHKIGDAKSISFDKAKRAAQMVRSRVVLGEDPAEERRTRRITPTLTELATEHYLPYVKGYKKSWDTDDSYLRNHILPRFGHHRLDEITPTLLGEFHHGLKAQGYALATANRMIILLRYMYNLAKKWGLPGSQTNPTAGVKLFEVNNARERFLTAEETRRLYDAIKQSPNPQLQYIVSLLLLLGNRKRELLNAKWEDFDLERRTWRIPLSKSGKSRHVPLSQAAIKVLEQIPRFENCPYVLPNPKTKKPFVSIFASWNTARKAAGLADVRMHDLRHTMASNMVNSGRSIYEVSRVLGHTQLRTTQRYSHLSQETLLAAVDAAAEATGTDWNASG